MRLPSSPDEARRLAIEVDPGLWDRTVAQAIEGRDNVRPQDIYDHLHAVGLLASDTPNADQRGRVSSALEARGFTRAESVSAEGKRHRMWRRVTATDVAAE